MDNGSTQAVGPSSFAARDDLPRTVAQLNCCGMTPTACHAALKQRESFSYARDWHATNLLDRVAMVQVICSQRFSDTYSENLLRPGSIASVRHAMCKW